MSGLQTMHLIADLLTDEGLTSAKNVEAFIRSVVLISGLTIVHLHVQEFTNGSAFGPGITGMALLSESHMVVHTAPERSSLNIDLFSCKPFDETDFTGEIEKHFGTTAIRRWDILER
jgi:S-adenosylmethionine decarboxylase